MDWEEVTSNETQKNETTYDNDLNSVGHMDTNEPDENPSFYPCKFC